MTQDQTDQLLSLLSRFVASQEAVARMLTENQLSHARVAAAQETSATVSREKWEYETSLRAKWEANNDVVAETNRANLETAKFRREEANLALELMKLRAGAPGGG